MSEPWPCLSARGERTLLAVAVTPNARRTGADGLHDGALRVRLAAPPVDGKANDALTAWLALQLGLPKRSVEVLRGTSARRKQLTIELEESAVARWLDSLGITR